MDIIVNKNSVSIAEEASVQALIDRLLGEKQNGIAVAIGESIVPRTEWKRVQLKENDSITIITATQGG